MRWSSSITEDGGCKMLFAKIKPLGAFVYIDMKAAHCAAISAHRLRSSRFAMYSATCALYCRKAAHMLAFTSCRWRQS